MAATVVTSDDFKITVGDGSPGYNLPQRIGKALWLPMLLMALMAFPVAVILGAVRANEIATGGSETTIAALGHFAPAVAFIGFASVFAAITFAIARILGEFRNGGGLVQSAAHRSVKTLKFPATATLMIVLMMMAMMALVVAIVLHFVAGAAIAGGSEFSLARAEQWGVWLEAVRRGGVAVYLLSITFGLATIVEVLRFQAIRVRELPAERDEVLARPA